MTRPAKPKRRYPVEPLTPAEVARLLRQCSTTAPTGIRNRALITVMYRGGLRINEALALRASDVDASWGTIRGVPVDDGSMVLIHRWIEERATLPGELLFCNLDGAPLSAVYVRNMLHRISREAGLCKRVTPETLRRAWSAVDAYLSAIAPADPVMMLREMTPPLASVDA
jgi:site-specific recombinase XerD